MSNAHVILVIDDDPIVGKVVAKALQECDCTLFTAKNGELGIAAAIEHNPDIILLDVEMPGMNGYEVCEKLRNIPETQDTSIVFLSSHGSLKERLQGYEVGADDYIVKPFEPKFLIARIEVLANYNEHRRELILERDLAQKTALIAMSGTSELGQAMHFLEKSLSLSTLEELAKGTLEVTDRLSLDCCIYINLHGQAYWFDSDGEPSPLEKELVEMSDRSSRFLDFGENTLVNYPLASILAKNMPLGDPERYGRIKDLLPVLLSALNTRLSMISTQMALSNQNEELKKSIRMIRSNLYGLGTTILQNREDSTKIMQDLMQELNADLLRMGLEEDQEDYLIDRLDNAIEDAMTQMDAGYALRAAFSFVLNNLKDIHIKQQQFIDAFEASQAVTDEGNDEISTDDIELF